MAKDKEIFENEIKEYVRKRNHEIVDTLHSKIEELTKRAKAHNDEDHEEGTLIALETNLAMMQALESTRDLFLLVFETMPSMLKPYYHRRLKTLLASIEANGPDHGYFESTKMVLDMTIGSEVVSIPSRRDK